MPLSKGPDATDASVGVAVAAPARLHLGFLDPSGTLGRRFGSLGLVVGGFQTRLHLRRAPAAGLSASPQATHELVRAGEHLAALQRHSGRADPLHLHLAETLPSHAGFGSGTQLALAVGHAFARLHGLTLTSSDIAQLLGRGRRSGIGVAAFEQGGLLLDGGPGADGSPAPLIARLSLPPAWRVLLVLDPTRDGLNGMPEKEAIEALPRFPPEAAAAVCHEVLMRVLAGAAANDFAAFATGLSRVQQLVGEHFAPAQGGSLYSSPAVARVCEWIATQSCAGIGQSSWGPTGFAILPSATAAERLQEAVHAAGLVDASLRLRIVAPRSHGATIDTTA